MIMHTFNTKLPQPIRLTFGNKLLIWSACYLLLTVLAGKLTAAVPSDEAIKGELRGRIPRYLKVESVATELVSQADSTVKMNFDAKLAPKEDLFVEDTAPAVQQAPAAPKLLKVTQKEGASGKVYGSFTAIWRMDHWTFQQLTIDEGLAQFGRPQSAFGPGYVVGGTAEAEAAQKAYNDAIAKQEAMNAEQRQKLEAEAKRLKQALLEATVPGTVYEGVIRYTYQQQQQGLQIRFLEQNGLMVKCELINPGNTAHRRLFTGEIHLPKTPTDFSLTLGPETTPQGLTGNPWEFYTGSGKINLRLTEDRLEGESRFLWEYTIKVTRKSAPAANAPAGAVTTSPATDNQLVVFSKPLPGQTYRPESPADWVEGYKQARLSGGATVQSQSGNDPLGLKSLNKVIDGSASKAGSGAGQAYNSKLRGQPLHYTAKFLKTSNFLGDHSIMLGIADDLTLTLKPKVGQAGTMELLQPGDDVEFIGEFGSVDALLFRGVFGWTLTISSAEIIAIKRGKS